MRDRSDPDVLTTVLRHIRITTSRLARVELGAPWGVGVGPRDTVSLYHVLSGELWLTCAGAETAVRAGDLVVLPHGTSYELRHRPGAPIDDQPPWPASAMLSVRHRNGGFGAETVLLCAELDLAGAARERLVRALPPIVSVVAGGLPGLDALLDLLRQEVRAARPGVALVAARLTELILVQSIRIELARPAAPGSWRAGLTDDAIARALDVMYTRPEHPWTLVTLAKAAGLTRTTFATRFRELVGETPFAHLTRWRMAHARELLREEPTTLADIATRVGYADEFAFSTAFRREVGVPPGAYRTATATTST